MSEPLNIEKELKELASHLPVQAPRTPYSVPAGYFEGLAGQVLDRIRNEEAQAELESLSPLLSKLNRSTPYPTPVGYFENTPTLPGSEPARVVSLTSLRWIRYAASAAVILGVFFWVGRNDQSSPGTASNLINEYQKDIQQLNEQQQTQLGEFVEAGMTGPDTTQVSNAQPLPTDLLADVSELEMSEFFEQSEYITSTSVNN